MTVLPCTQRATRQGGLAGQRGHRSRAPAAPATGHQITQAANGPQAGPESQAWPQMKWGDNRSLLSPGG